MPSLPGFVPHSVCNLLQALEFLATYNTAPASTVGSVVVTDLVTGLSAEEVDIAWVRWPHDCCPAMQSCHCHHFLI